MCRPLSLTFLLVAAIFVDVQGHGRLTDPPARSTMWRFGFEGTPRNFNDNELFCGGFSLQWHVNDGKCGVCGDPYGGPYNHEIGGKYYTDRIASRYTKGQVFTSTVELTASHKGWFEFRVCAPNNLEESVSQECLDQHLLPLADGSSTRYMVTKSGHVFHKVPLRLPSDLTCDFCVLQWKYHTGNSWGTDADGTSCLGCGAQEEFYGCANIQIIPSDENVSTLQPTGPSDTPVLTPTPGTPVPTMAPNPETSTSIAATPPPTTPAPPVSSPAPATAIPPEGTCRGADGPHKSTPGIDDWCVTNCAAGYCPPSHCICTKDKEIDQTKPICKGADGPHKSTPGIDDWCVTNCAAGYCPPSHCICTPDTNTTRTKRSKLHQLLKKLLEEEEEYINKENKHQ